MSPSEGARHRLQGRDADDARRQGGARQRDPRRSERLSREGLLDEEIADAVRMAAGGETVLSPQLAKSMLEEVRRLDERARNDEERMVTKREEEVLQLIADGCSTPEVAERLYISQKTVKNHLASIYQKLDARDRTQAVLQAVRMGIVHLD
ncbi:MAG: response regulator transcription factor [Actinobacteria bacterium]|nr:response regulator transcription factor [Actinomycetota bacterium]